MSAFTWIGDSFAMRVAATLLHFFWQGLLIAGFVVVAGLILRQASAKLRYSVNVAALMLMAVCLPVTFALVSVPVEDAAEPLVASTVPIEFEAKVTPLLKTATEATKTEPAEEPASAEVSSSVGKARLAVSPSAVPAEPENSPAATEEIASLVERLEAWVGPAATFVTWSYFAGVLLMSLRLALGLRGGQDLRRLSTPIEDEGLLATVRAQAERLGLRAVPPVAFCDHISIPIVIGVVRPVVLLPACLVTGLSHDQLWALVTHELAHIRRYDLLVNLLQRIVEAVLFFHPAVWLVSRRVSSEREIVADDAVLEAGCPATRYADALVRMAELSLSARNPKLTTRVTALAATGGSSSEFKRRVLRLLDKSATPQLRLTRGGILAVAMAASSLLAVPFVAQAWPVESQESDKPETAAVSEETSEEANQNATTKAANKEDSEKKDTNKDSPTAEAKTIDGFVQGPKGAIAGVRAVVTLSVPDDDDPRRMGMRSGKTVRELVYRTGENGRYQITIPAGLMQRPDLRIAVKLTHPDYLERVIGAVPVSDFGSRPANSRERGIHRSMVPGAIAQSRLRNAHKLQGRVTLPDGSPAAGAVVRTATKYRPYSWKFFSPDEYGFSATTTTDKEGRFSMVTDDRSTLTVFLAGEAPLLIDDLQERLKLHPGPDLTPEFRLPPGIRLKGRVLDDHGKPVPRAIVSARRDFPWNESNMPLSFSTTCAADDQGEYELPPLPVDQYKLSIGSRLSMSSSVDEYNSYTGSFNTATKPETETEPLDLVFVPLSRKLEFTEPLPRLDLKSSPMVSVRVKVLFPDGAPDPTRSSDVGITGLMDGRNWQGRYVKADENGVAVLRAPRGLRLAAIKTGLARHRQSADSPIEIGQAIHLGELEGDRDGFIVIKPKFAKLRVKLSLTEELSQKLGRGKAHIAITARYVRKGYRENSPTPQQMMLTGSTQSGTSSYEGTALPDEPVLLRVTIQEGNDLNVVHEEELTLAAGEDQLKEIAIVAEKKAEATSKLDTAIQKAANYLKSQQRADGSWPSGMSGDSHGDGATSLVALAMLDTGKDSKRTTEIAIANQLKASPEFTKEVALQTLLLHRAGKPGAQAVVRNLRWLVKAQIKDGPDAGSWSYRQEPVGARGDGANFAYALLALAVAAPADNAEAEELIVAPKVWQRAQDWLIKNQHSDGGWGYVRQAGQSTGAMTACALTGLQALAKRLDKSADRDTAIKRGNAWLQARWSPQRNPGSKSWNLFYLAWTCRALAGMEKLGQIPWHEQVCESLLKRQGKNGSFAPENPSTHAAISTAFALEILKHCRSEETAAK